MVKEELRELEHKMKGSVEHFRKDLSRLRTGRANIGIFEDIKVDYYGALTPVNQVATLAVPDPTLISIQPWDTSLLETIDKAIRAADLGLNPINDGKILKIVPMRANATETPVTASSRERRLNCHLPDMTRRRTTGPQRTPA